MATTRTTSTLAGVALAVVLLGVAWPARGRSARPRSTAFSSIESTEEYEEEGYAAAKARHQEPDAIEAAFPLESYRPGATAVLRIWTPTRAASVRVFHVGPEPQLTIGDKLMEGVPVTAPRRFAALRAGQTICDRVGNWPSGLYFAKVTAPGRLGFAPFVVRAEAARRAPGRARPPHPHMAGVQLPRRRRRRKGRHVVRDGGSPAGAARPPVPEPRRAAALPQLRPALPALAAPVRPEGGRPLTGRARQHDGRSACTGVRADGLPRSPRVRDRHTSTTPSRASATAAAT